MPGWKVHNFTDKILLGKSYPKVHRRIDKPYKYFGRDHRILFHDLPTAIGIAKDSYPDDPKAVGSAYFHLLYDEICSKDPEYKKNLENLVILSRKKRKPGKTKTTRPFPELSTLIEDMRKAGEVRKLARAILS